MRTREHTTKESKVLLASHLVRSKVMQHIFGVKIYVLVHLSKANGRIDNHVKSNEIPVAASATGLAGKKTKNRNCRICDLFYNLLQEVSIEGKRKGGGK